MEAEHTKQNVSKSNSPFPVPPPIIENLEKLTNKRTTKLFLLAFLVALVPLTILVALTQQTLQQSAYSKNTSLEKILKQQESLLATQLQFSAQLDQELKDNEMVDTNKLSILQKQEAAIWDLPADTGDVQKEKSLITQANAIKILPTDSVTDKLQKTSEKLTLVTNANVEKQKRVRKICLKIPKFRGGKGRMSPTPTGVSVTPSVSVSPTISETITPSPSVSVTVSPTTTPTTSLTPSVTP